MLMRGKMINRRLRGWTPILAIFAGLAYLTATTPPSRAQSIQSSIYVTPGDLIAAINSQNVDEILSTTNSIKGMRYKGDILPFVQSLWQEDRVALPDVDWQMARAPVVRIELADILLQAKRNGLVDIDQTPIETYLRGQVVQVRGYALAQTMLTLSMLDDAEDVPVIYAVAEKSRSFTFGAAVIALSRMCNAAAILALNRLQEAVKDEGEVSFLGNVSPLDYIRDTRSSFSDSSLRCSS